MATLAQLQTYIKATAKGVDQTAFGAAVIGRAMDRNNDDTTAANADLLPFGLVVGQTPGSNWMGVDSSGANMPTHDGIPTSAGEDCTECLLRAFAVLLAMLEAAGDNQTLIDIAWAVYDYMVDDCPCDVTW